MSVFHLYFYPLCLPGCLFRFKADAKARADAKAAEDKLKADAEVKAKVDRHLSLF